MKLKFFLFICLSFYILNSTFTIATVRYVSKTGSSTFPYTSWTDAADSIQKCINICSFGDTVYVANGVYIEKIVMRHGLTLIGAGMDSCIIDTRTIAVPPDYYTLTMRDECSIEGFHIITLSNQGGTVGILCFPGPSDSLYFQGKIINNKISKAGRGIYTSNAFLAIKDNIIENVGEGIRVSALDTTVLDSIYNNYLFQIINKGINTSLGCRAIIFNNYVQLEAEDSDGIGIGSAGTSAIFNNLIFTNKLLSSNNFRIGITSGVYGDIVYNNLIKIDKALGNNNDQGIRFGQQGLIKNNIIMGSEYGFYRVSGNINVTYNNTWDCIQNSNNFLLDTTNLSVNPMVVNEDSLDFHLQKYSPLIDAGDPSILDKDGSRSDIGLYGGPFGESYKYLDLAPSPPLNLTAVLDSNEISLSWNKNSEADTSFYKVYRDTVINFQVDSTKLISSSADTFFVQINPHNVTKYVYKITCVDKQSNESSPSEEKVVVITGIENYPQIITDYQLYQNYPNPFNPSTKISYRLKERGFVKLYLYDIKGELVSTLVNKNQESGFYQVEFNTTNYLQTTTNSFASGVYIYQILVTGENNIPVFTDIKKMMMIK